MIGLIDGDVKEQKKALWEAIQEATSTPGSGHYMVLINLLLAHRGKIKEKHGIEGLVWRTIALSKFAPTVGILENIEDFALRSELADFDELTNEIKARGKVLRSAGNSS
jgi:hypothetical protein